MRIAKLAVVYSIMLVALPAAAQDDGPPTAKFGASHVLALSSDANLSFQHVSVSPGSVSSTTFVLRPAADFFVVDNFSLGGTVLAASASTSSAMAGSGGTVTSFGIGARAGYNVRLGDRVSIWPKGGVSFVTVSAAGSSDSHVALGLSAPLLYHPVAHFLLGLGPDLNVDLSGMIKTTTLGFAFTVGGWF